MTKMCLGSPDRLADLPAPRTQISGRFLFLFALNRAPNQKALAFGAQQRYGRTHRKGRFFLTYHTATNDSRNN